jgi:secondary thiamine-phosphate synthase enzyme
MSVHFPWESYHKTVGAIYPKKEHDAMKRYTVEISSTRSEQLIDVTEKLRRIAKQNPDAMLMALFSKGATSAVMIQENWDPDICFDILECLADIAPKGKWRHDRVDGNADAHIKAGIVGPSETVPLENGEMLLGTWQNVFFCDFDGPRAKRELIVTVM